MMSDYTDTGTESALLLGFVILFIFIICLIFFIREVFSHYFRHRKRLRPADVIFLYQHNRYFRNLSLPLKRLFLHRLHNLWNIKEFVPMEMDEVSRKTEILIMSMAVQLTFGFKKYALYNFKKIYVAPDTFHMPGASQPYAGLTSSQGYIIFSEKALFNSIATDNDGYHIGIHEFAHAITLDTAYEHLFWGKAYKTWKADARKKIEVIRAGNNTLFSDYSGTNIDEFFAHSIEQFFEQPEVLAERFPKKYHSIRQLLKQNPIAAEYPLESDTSWEIMKHDSAEDLFLLITGKKYPSIDILLRHLYSSNII